MNKKIGIIVFARTSSKRLPNKIFQKISGIKLIDLVINRLKKIKIAKKNYEIIVNTSVNIKDNKIENYCLKRGIKFFRGSLNNVFLRTYHCLKKNKYKIFVRVNCDRPFVDVDIIKKMINLINNNDKFDIISNCVDKCPKGLSCEVSKAKVFFDNFKNIKKKDHKEHIFNYFYENQNKFNILKYNDPIYQKNLNVNFSIDTKNDKKRINRIFYFFKKNYFIKTSDVLKKIEKIKLE